MRSVVKCVEGVKVALTPLLGLVCIVHPLMAQGNKKPLPQRVASNHWANPLGPVHLVGGFWRVDHSFESELQISNRLATDSILVHPALTLDNGSVFTLKDINLQPSGTAVVNINGELNSVVPSAVLAHHQFGTISLSYDWHWEGAISAEVQNIDSTRSLSYVSSLQPEPDISSAQETIRGLWWKKTASTAVFIRLSNATRSAITAQLTVTDQNNRQIATESMVVKPSETVLRDIPAILAADVAALGGIDVAYIGQMGGLMVDGGLEDPNNGFSAGIPFYRPSQVSKPPKPITLATTGIMIGSPGPGLMFPPQVYFRPWLKLRNVSSEPRPVSVTGTYMLGFNPVSVPVAQLTLSPMGSADVDVEGVIHALNLPPLVMELNLAVSYRGLSSDLIVSSGSVDDAGSYVFEVPTGVVSQGVSKDICYWKAGDGIDTMISVWNHDDASQDFFLVLHFGDGSYKYPIHLNAQSSTTVNIFDVLHSGKPDADGNIFPAGIEAGSATLQGLAGEVEPINVTITPALYDVGHATCAWTCTSCNGYTSYSILPAPWDSPYPNNVQLSATAHFSTGNNYSMTAATTWSSQNTSVANVGNGSSAGLVSPVAVGNATIGGVTDPLPHAGKACGAPPDCSDLDQPLGGTAGGNFRPSVSFSSIPYVGVGQTASINATVTPPSNTTPISLSISGPAAVVSPLGTFTQSTTVIVKGLSAGTATLTASASNSDGTFTIGSTSFPVQSPTITGISPDTIALGATNVQVTISGSTFGSSPTVNLPSGVTIHNGNQASTDSSVVIAVDVAFTATIGNNNISVTAGGQSSNNYQVVLDGPYSLIVEDDTTAYFNNNSAYDVQRFMTYQIQSFSNTNASSVQICEIPSNTSSNPPCSPAVPSPTANWCSGVAGQIANPHTTTSDGRYTDGWTLAAANTYYSPSGCGINITDPWYWNPQSSIRDELGQPSGYVHTNAIQIDGYVSTPTNQNKIPVGSTMPK
jgi:hypothetical protein